MLEVNNKPIPKNLSQNLPWFTYVNEDMTDEQYAKLDKLFVISKSSLNVYGKYFTEDGERMCQHYIKVNGNELPVDWRAMTSWKNTLHLRHEGTLSLLMGAKPKSPFIHPEVLWNLATHIEIGSAEVTLKEDWRYIKTGGTIINLNASVGAEHYR